MDPLTRQLLATGEGAQPELPLIDDVYHGVHRVGTASNTSVTNGIDNAGHGGLVWIKCTNQPKNHVLFDTERGAGKFLYSNQINSQTTVSDSLTSFNSNGYSLGPDHNVNDTPDMYASYNFRRGYGFFDVVSWVGDGTYPRTIPHSLGYEPGLVMIKIWSGASENWWCYWKESPNGYRDYYSLNLSDAANTTATAELSANSSSLTIDTYYNESPKGYVAYLFANDSPLVKCGTYTGNGSNTTPKVVNVGFTPAFILIKNSSSTGNWMMFNTTLGITSGSDYYLKANDNSVEASGPWIDRLVNGFQLTQGGSDVNTLGSTYMYMAIADPNG